MLIIFLGLLTYCIYKEHFQVFIPLELNASNLLLGEVSEHMWLNLYLNIDIVEMESCFSETNWSESMAVNCLSEYLKQFEFFFDLLFTD